MQLTPHCLEYLDLIVLDQVTCDSLHLVYFTIDDSTLYLNLIFLIGCVT